MTPKAHKQEQVDHADTVHPGGVASPPPKSALSSAQTAGAPFPTPAASIPADSSLRVAVFPRNHKHILTQKALIEIYGSNVYDTEENCFRKVNQWPRTNERDPVSKATLRRAKRALRAGTKPERN
jgi:hypothetical protein